MYPLGRGPVPLLHSDPPLGTRDEVVGDTRGPAAFPVVGPTFWQEQLAVQEGLVTPLADAERDGDDAVVHLAETAQVLALDTWRLGTLFDGTGLVDQADDSHAVVGQGGQGVGDLLLAEVAHLVFVPSMILEELLESADGCTGLEGDRLDALAWQVGEQTADVGAQVLKGLGVAAAEEIACQKGGQSRSQGSELTCCHKTTSTPGWRFPMILSRDVQSRVAL